MPKLMILALLSILALSCKKEPNTEFVNQMTGQYHGQRSWVNGSSELNSMIIKYSSNVIKVDNWMGNMSIYLEVDGTQLFVKDEMNEWTFQTYNGLGNIYFNDNPTYIIHYNRVKGSGTFDIEKNRLDMHYYIERSSHNKNNYQITETGVFWLEKN